MYIILRKELKLPTSGKNYIPYTFNNLITQEKGIANIHTEGTLLPQSRDSPTLCAHTHTSWNLFF